MSAGCQAFRPCSSGNQDAVSGPGISKTAVASASLPLRPRRHPQAAVQALQPSVFWAASLRSRNTRLTRIPDGRRTCGSRAAIGSPVGSGRPPAATR